MTRWLDDDQQRAWRGLLAMNTKLMARLNRGLQETSGLSLADYDVLVALTDVPDQTLRMGELGHALEWEKSRLSKHISRMVARGLVVRRDSADDRRSTFVELTDAGCRAIESAAPDHVALVIDLVFAQLTEAQVKQLARISQVVVDRVESAAD